MLQTPQAEKVASATINASAEQIREAVMRDCEQRGVRFHQNLFEHVEAVYSQLRRWRKIGGDGTVSIRQIARDLYPDVGDDYAAYRRKQQSIRRWLAVLERQGLISKRELRSATGKTLGLQTAQLPVPEEITRLSRVRGCSSAGSSDRVGVPRRRMGRQERCEARVRPYCPRADRGAPRRFDRPAAFFSPEKLGSPRGRGGSAPKGPPPSPERTAWLRAREGPGAGSVDAIERDGAESPVAALEPRLTAALGGEAFSALSRAEEAFVAVLGAPPAGRLAHLPTIRELLWVLGRLDRYASFGRGQAGAGLAFLEGRIEIAAWAVRWEGAAAPKHLAYFLPELRAEARRWKHTWAPRIKRARRASHPSPAGPRTTSRREKNSRRYRRGSS